MMNDCYMVNNPEIDKCKTTQTFQVSHLKFCHRQYIRELHKNHTFYSKISLLHPSLAAYYSYREVKSPKQSGFCSYQSYLRNVSLFRTASAQICHRDQWSYFLVCHIIKSNLTLTLLCSMLKDLHDRLSSSTAELNINIQRMAQRRIGVVIVNIRSPKRRTRPKRNIILGLLRYRLPL